MNYRSASTRIADPYRAGAELGDRLESLNPDTVLVFCTMHYMDSIRDLVAGIRDVLGTDVLICGGTGDESMKRAAWRTTVSAPWAFMLMVHRNGRQYSSEAFTRTPQASRKKPHADYART